MEEGGELSKDDIKLAMASFKVRELEKPRRSESREV